jgi:glycosyltransferase involved in cell wall biosynthesis
MRLLFITDNFPNPCEPTRGVFNFELARALVREHQVRVVSPVSWLREWQLARAGRHLPAGREAVLDGVEVHCPRYYYTPKVLRNWYGSFLWHSVRRTVERLIREERPDVVVGYWSHPDGEVAVRTARLAGVPAIVMVGGSDVLLLTRDRRRRRLIQRVLHDADAVITTSQDLRLNLLRQGLPADKVHVVYRGVDQERFSPGDRGEARRRLGIPSEGLVLVGVGRLVPVKGFDVLLDACGRLREQGLCFRLYLVGDGPCRCALESQVRALGLAEAVTFAGMVQHQALADWYRAADLTVLPSRSEGVPNVLRESLSCGTPFVASRVGGIAELPVSSGSRLVPPEDARALAEAIAGAAVDKSSRPANAQASQSWSESAAALVNVIRPLLAHSVAKQGPVVPAGLRPVLQEIVP